MGGIILFLIIAFLFNGLVFALLCPPDEYDFIVVGAGTSGCVVANRLSKDPNNRVLLLERGADAGALKKNPLASLGLAFFLDFASRYRGEPSEYYCLGKDKMRCKAIVGKTTGGTSAINGLIYTRGRREDYDDWPEGWSWDDLLPYFVSLENFRDKQDPEKPVFGTLGERSLTYTDIPLTNLSKVFLKAGTNLTQKYVMNGQVTEGFVRLLTTIKDGERQDTYSAFIAPVLSERPNLKVVTSAFVTKILFKGNTAVGLEYTLESNPLLKIQCRTKARREIILSAGAIGTPQLLMVSGMGPRQTLNRFNIKVLSDLPVGQNLHDHVACLGVNFITSRASLINAIEQDTATYGDYTAAFVEWLLTREGKVSSIPVQVYGYVYAKKRLGDIKEKEEAADGPDVEFLLIPATISGPPASLSPILNYAANLGKKEYQKVYVPRLGIDGFSVLVSVMRPRSRGNVTLSSPDMRDDPSITFNYFSDPYDIDTLVQGMKFLIKMSKTEPFKQINTELWDIPFPGCETYEMYSDPYLDCLARHFTLTYYHYSGTCKMGRGKGDPTAVVDPQLRVIGVNNLRVMDASIMPTLNTGHPQGPCGVIGAKGADMILGNPPPPLRYY